MISKQNTSKSITYKYSPGVHRFKDSSEFHSRGFKNEIEIGRRIRPNHKNYTTDSIIIESDNVRLINELNVNPQIHILRFHKNRFSLPSQIFHHIGIIKVIILNTIVEKIEI